jgi:2,4-dienoyl-CoA reductase-like NADH-dependent reductase (Old Yellow Enzyme family)
MKSTNDIDIVKLASLRTPEAFHTRCRSLGLDIPVDDAIEGGSSSPLARPLSLGGITVGNRWVTHPMEGWDATSDGRPTELVARRWQRFALSGAKLLWGMEAVAIDDAARANPRQLVLRPDTVAEIVATASGAVETHRQAFGSSDDLLWGLQLTHSGRYCRPRNSAKPEPRIAYRHPILDARVGIDSDAAVLTDDEVKRLIESFVNAAALCDRSGIRFVDVKQCHGYLLHEFLSAYTRRGPYGGDDLANRTRAAREIIEGIRQVAPRLTIGVRLSAFDLVPFRPDPSRTHAGSMGPGIPEDFSRLLPYRYAFGVNPADPTEPDLAEPVAYLRLLQSWGVAVVNISCGSPYYNPHIQRPALYPPSDGYQPAADPLIDVNRIIQATRALKAAVPTLPLVSTGLTYLQEHLPLVAQALVRQGWTDMVGVGRMLLSYPHMIADAMNGSPLQSRLICRTFSDCTSAPRNGLTSGCYPLDVTYRDSSDGDVLRRLKRTARETSSS